MPDDDFHYALTRGVLYRYLPLWPRDGRIVAATGMYLSKHIVEHRLGLGFSGSGFILERDPDTLLCPNLSFVRGDRVSADMDGYPELAPDLVVEINTPYRTSPSIEEKAVTYLKSGVRLIWVIDRGPRTVRVQRGDGRETLLTDQDEIDGEDVLPGFKLPVAQLFA